MSPVKCYKNTEVPGSDVNRLHGAIPSGGQGARITTSDFSKGAKEEVDKPGFPHVSLINGRRLVDLLKEYWNSESLAASPEPAEEVPSWHERLGLTQGLSDPVGRPLLKPLNCPSPALVLFFSHLPRSLSRCMLQAPQDT